MSALGDEALAFAERLNTLVHSTIGTSHEFEVLEDEDGARARIGPRKAGEEVGFDRIPLRRTCDPPDGLPPLSLNVQYSVTLDDQERRYLTVQKSAFGLWVRVDPGRSPSPVFRIEYDRDAHSSKPSAHVHFHAESVELGWVYGTAGRKLPRLQEIHFPVGGRRFRPTVEEVLLFLDREKLFTDWLPGWDSVVSESLDEWEHRQARATVRQRPRAAVEVLTERGYTVIPPQYA